MRPRGSRYASRATPGEPSVPGANSAIARGPRLAWRWRGGPPMHVLRHVALLGFASVLFACATSENNDGPTAAAVVDAAADAAAAVDATDLPPPGNDAGKGIPTDPDSGADSPSTTDAAANADAMAPTPAQYTLTITSPQPNASVSGTINVVGMGPGFLNVEIHATTGTLLARVTPGSAGGFSAPVD